MLKSFLSLPLIISVVSGAVGMVPAKVSTSFETESRPVDLINDSTSGITFGSLADGRSGRLWIGGSVFGIQGLLLETGTQRLRVHRVKAVEFILDLSFTSKRAGWMIADGLLYHSSDAGTSWQNVRSIEPGSGLKTLCFISDRVGWVGGRNGRLMHTTNGGSSWRKQNIEGDFTIEQVRFVNRDKGWAIAKDISPPETRTILLLTSDGGTTWRKAPDSDDQQFRSVIFVDPSLGWGINSEGDIVQSMDGGEHWKIQRRADGTFWSSVFFANKLEGWASGDGIIHTVDGGKSWEYQLRTNGSSEDVLNAIMFAGSRNGAVIGLTRVLVTHNGGATWKPLSDSWKSAVTSSVRREKFKQ